MLYIKSVFVGTATDLITIVISMIVWIVIAANQLHRQFPHAEIAFDVHSMLARPSIVWLIGTVALSAAFTGTSDDTLSNRYVRTIEAAIRSIKAARSRNI